MPNTPKYNGEINNDTRVLGNHNNLRLFNDNRKIKVNMTFRDKGETGSGVLTGGVSQSPMTKLYEKPYQIPFNQLPPDQPYTYNNNFNQPPDKIFSPIRNITTQIRPAETQTDMIDVAPQIQDMTSSYQPTPDINTVDTTPPQFATRENYNKLLNSIQSAEQLINENKAKPDINISPIIEPKKEEQLNTLYEDLANAKYATGNKAEEAKVAEEISALENKPSKPELSGRKKHIYESMMRESQNQVDKNNEYKTNYDNLYGAINDANKVINENKAKADIKFSQPESKIDGQTLEERKAAFQRVQDRVAKEKRVYADANKAKPIEVQAEPVQPDIANVPAVRARKEYTRKDPYPTTSSRWFKALPTNQQQDILAWRELVKKGKMSPDSWVTQLLPPPPEHEFKAPKKIEKRR